MSLLDTLQRDGRFPEVRLIIKPLDKNREQLIVGKFLEYSFDSSILIPVDSFSFSFVAAGDSTPISQLVEEGDIALLEANGQTIAVGIIDQIDIEVDRQFGERVTITGRDLMSQFEDQDSISLDSKPIFAKNVTVKNGVDLLRANTRIQRSRLQDAPSGLYLLATEPGETKLSTLQRFIDAINCVSWMDPDGTIVVGKPNMSQKPIGNLVCSRTRRYSNVLSIRVSRASTSIPNIVVPILTGQELVVSQIGVQQAIYNNAPGPSSLRSRGHRVLRTVITSYPQGSDPQALDQVNRLKAAAGNLLQAMAKREIAKQNIKEVIVQVVVPGHYNEAGDPYRVDTVYHVEFDRANLNEAMYLYQVEYLLTDTGGQRTNLYFCRLGTIVADVKAAGT